MLFKQLVVGTLCAGGAVAAGLMWWGGGAATGSSGEVVAAAVTWQPEGFQPSPEQIKHMMEEQAKPAPEHANFKPLIGKWHARMSFVEGPGQAPTVTEGSCTNEWVLGGKYVQMHYEGTVSMFGEEYPFKGMGLLGFDKVRGEYTMMWADSLSTSMIVSYGRPGENAGEIALSGKATSPMGEMAMKHVYKIESNDKHVLEFWQSMPGVEEMMKVGQIEYTRKGG
ncbi:MAG: DUF1579 domain-containing protein [Planctomycetota bacterium]|nr:MAG: DUF1579 domain-containing protein [Planctomycetota bacterium]